MAPIPPLPASPPFLALFSSSLSSLPQEEEKKKNKATGGRGQGREDNKNKNRMKQRDGIDRIRAGLVTSGKDSGSLFPSLTCSISCLDKLLPPTLRRQEKF